MDTGTISITESDMPASAHKIAIYARVSSSENRNNLEAQAERLVNYRVAKGWQVSKRKNRTFTAWR